MNRVSDTEGQPSHDCRNLENDDQMETESCESFPDSVKFPMIYGLLTGFSR